METCSVENCPRILNRHSAKGMCGKHYKRFRKYGDPTRLITAPRGSDTEDRLQFTGWQVTDKGCWEWLGRRDPDGYGTITMDRRPYRAHRAAYEVWVNLIPQGHVVRHACDNPPCINPSHLLTGLPRDNSQDAVERERVANGERHGMHRLTDAEVIQIRSQYKAGGVKQRELAHRFGCSQSQVNNILLGRQRRSPTFAGDCS